MNTLTLKQGRENQRQAQMVGLKTYQSRPCRSCGCTERYTKSKGCTGCARARYTKTDENKERIRKQARQWRLDNPVKQKLLSARGRAVKKGWAFDLDMDDITIPDVCPVFGTPFEVDAGLRSANCPSLDRLDSTKGYTKDNVRVISWRANSLKSDATLEELRAIVAWMEREMTT